MKKDLFFFSVVIIVLILIFLLPRLITYKNLYGIEICDNMTYEFKSMCYAMFFKDYKYCRLTTGSLLFCADYVFSNMDLNSSFCESLDGYYKVSCSLHLALKKKDLNLCSIGGAECFYFLAQYLNLFKINKEFCNNVSEESLRFTCLAFLTKDENICDNIVVEKFEVPDCKAVASRKLEFCEDSINKDSCIYKLAILNNDIKLCDRIDSKWIKNQCLVILKKDLSFCNEFHQPMKDFCVMTYIYFKNIKLI